METEKTGKKKKGVSRNPNGPPPEYRWKKGQSGNPNGRVSLPTSVRSATKLSAKLFIEYVNRYIHMDREKIKADMKRSEATMLELMVAGMVLKAVTTQDVVKVNFLLDRTIGKVIDRMEMEVHLPKPTIIEKLNGQQLILGYSDPTIDGEYIDENNSGNRIESSDT